MSKNNKDSKLSSSCVYMSFKINNKDLETIYYIVSVHFDIYLFLSYGRNKGNIK